MNNYVFVLILISVDALSEDCNNTCYDGFPQKLQHLVDIYTNPPNVTNLPSNYKNINRLIKEIREIPKNKTNITSIPAKLKLSNETILKQKEIIQKIEDIVKLLNVLNRDFADMDNKTKFHNDTLETCDKAANQFDKLKKDIDEIEDIGRKVNDSYYKNLDSVDRIYTESRRIKKQLDNIKLPDLTSAYLCNSTLEENILDILKTANSLKLLLEYIKEHILDKLKKKIEFNNKILDDVSTLNKTLPELPLISNNETKPLIDRLRKELEDLKDKLKNITPNKNNLDEVKASNDEFLKELELFLQLLFSKENKERIKAEIKKAKQIMKVIRNRNKMKSDLEELEKIVVELWKGEVCTIPEDIDLEPNVQAE